MPAITHPGSVIHCWDHLVITLRSGPDGAETGFLSLYAITWSASLGPGNVAIVEVPAMGVMATIADQPGLGERQQSRLIGLGESRPSLRRAPITGDFERVPYGPAGFGFHIRTDDRHIEGRWEAPDRPFWVDGQNGGFHDSEDIWALMVGARRARLIVDGVDTAGAPFEDDAWNDKLGRPLSSAHGAFAEVRVQPISRPDRATGSERG